MLIKYRAFRTSGGRGKTDDPTLRREASEEAEEEEKKKQKKKKEKKKKKKKKQGRSGGKKIGFARLRRALGRKRGKGPAHHEKLNGRGKKKKRGEARAREGFPSADRRSDLSGLPDGCRDGG